MNYKVSLIVPMYNVAKYIKTCIDSILTQSYKNLELILVDDGSPDNSGKIADQYAVKDGRVKVIHKQNAGVSAARNTGIDAATGDYICFADGDDYVMPNYVEHLLKLCVDNGAEVAYTIDMFTTFHKEQVSNHYSQIISSDNTLLILM